MAQKTVYVCDRCSKSGNLIVRLKTQMVRISDGKVLLKAGEYCPNCVAGACGHECSSPSPDDDP